MLITLYKALDRVFNLDLFFTLASKLEGTRCSLWQLDGEGKAVLTFLKAFAISNLEGSHCCVEVENGPHVARLVKTLMVLLRDLQRLLSEVQAQVWIASQAPFQFKWHSFTGFLLF